MILRNLFTDFVSALRAACRAFVSDWQWAQACRAEAEQHYGRSSR